MIKLTATVLALSLAACTFSAEPAAPATASDAAPCPTLESAPLPAPDAAPAADTTPSVLTVVSILPAALDNGRWGGTLVDLKGTGFLKVRDVEVNVGSVPFTVISDTRIVFYAPALDEGTELPYRAQVDIIVVPSVQVQTAITYR